MNYCISCGGASSIRLPSITLIAPEAASRPARQWCAAEAEAISGDVWALNHFGQSSWHRTLPGWWEEPAYPCEGGAWMFLVAADFVEFFVWPRECFGSDFVLVPVDDLIERLADCTPDRYEVQRGFMIAALALLEVQVLVRARRPCVCLRHDWRPEGPSWEMPSTWGAE